MSAAGNVGLAMRPSELTLRRVILKGHFATSQRVNPGVCSGLREDPAQPATRHSVPRRRRYRRGELQPTGAQSMFGDNDDYPQLSGGKRFGSTTLSWRTPHTGTFGQVDPQRRTSAPVVTVVISGRGTPQRRSGSDPDLIASLLPTDHVNRVSVGPPSVSCPTDDDDRHRGYNCVVRTPLQLGNLSGPCRGCREVNSARHRTAAEQGADRHHGCHGPKAVRKHLFRPRCRGGAALDGLVR